MIVAEGADGRGRKIDIKSLQWGRNLIVAEGQRHQLRLGAISLLQWGRNLIVAEGWSIFRPR